MNKRLTRFAAVALAATLLVAFAENAHAGAVPGKTQPQTGSKSAAAKPQTKPQPVKPQPARPQQTSTIGTLNSSNSQPVIGTLKPSNPSSQPVIGTLKPSNPSKQPIIGTVSPIDPIIHGSDVIGGAGQEKPVDPVIPPSPPEPGPQVEPVLPPPIPQQTVQQGPSAPASDGPLIVQDEPAQSEPIIITPRTVRAGNVQSGGNRGQHEYGAGYSGGNGNGPLIYNP